MSTEPEPATETAEQKERRRQDERVAAFIAACNALKQTDNDNAYIVVKALEGMFRP